MKSHLKESLRELKSRTKKQRANIDDQKISNTKSLERNLNRKWGPKDFVSTFIVEIIETATMNGKRGGNGQVKPLMSWRLARFGWSDLSGCAT